MKPLELTIYPKLNGWALQIELRSKPKRFTDAELAAELWRHTSSYQMLTDGYEVESFGTDNLKAGPEAEWQEAERLVVIDRFATHPHALEARDVRE